MKVLLRMKSRNTITLHGVEKFRITYNEDDITGIDMTYRFPYTLRTRLLIQSICLKQIEAVESKRILGRW